MQAHNQDLQVKFIYVGHWVKVRITEAIKACLCIVFVGDLPLTERQCSMLSFLLLLILDSQQICFRRSWKKMKVDKRFMIHQVLADRGAQSCVCHLVNKHNMMTMASYHATKRHWNSIKTPINNGIPWDRQLDRFSIASSEFYAIFQCLQVCFRTAKLTRWKHQSFGLRSSWLKDRHNDGHLLAAYFCCLWETASFAARLALLHSPSARNFSRDWWWRFVAALPHERCVKF